MAPHNPPDDRLPITARQRLVLVTVASVGALVMLLIIFFGLIEIGWAGMCGGNTCAGGWHVNLLKAALILPPIAALLIAYLCSFSRTGNRRQAALNPNSGPLGGSDRMVLRCGSPPLHRLPRPLSDDPRAQRPPLQPLRSLTTSATGP